MIALNTGIFADNATLTLFDSTLYPFARCLDGTQSGLYLRPATNMSVSNSWLFVLDGGGACTHKEDCMSRSTSRLGSSSKWPTTFDLNTLAWTSDNAANPFRHWNMVFIEYCDGAEHTGTRTNATNETFGLYFSGHHTIAAAIDFLSKNNHLNDSDSRIVFGGGSAGGVGTFNSVEFVAETLSAAHVLGAPIGGFPPPLQWFPTTNTPPEEDLRDDAFRANNILYQAYLPKVCAAAVGAESAWRCAIPHFLYPYLTVPVFITESLTDSVVMCEFEGVPCDPPAKALLNQTITAYFAEYGQNATKNFQQVLRSTRDGLYAPSCLLHCGFQLTKPLIENVGAVQALYEWAMSYFEPVMSMGASNTSALAPRNATDHKYIDAPCTSFSHPSQRSFWPPCNKACPLKPDVQMHGNRVFN